MHRLSMAGVCVLIGFLASGCATLQSNRLACRLLAAGVGATAGGIGVGLAVGNSGLSENDRVPAAVGAAAGGAAAGVIAGLVVAHWACPPVEEAPQPGGADVVPAEPESAGDVVPAE